MARTVESFSPEELLVLIVLFSDVDRLVDRRLVDVMLTSGWLTVDELKGDILIDGGDELFGDRIEEELEVVGFDSELDEDTSAVLLVTGAMFA